MYLSSMHADLENAVDDFCDALTPEDGVPLERLKAAREALPDVAIEGVRTGVYLALAALEQQTNVDFKRTIAGFAENIDAADQAAAEDKYLEHAEAIAYNSRLVDADAIIKKVFDAE